MTEHSHMILYRMVLPDHTCPFGLLAKRMLDEAGLPFEDKILSSREDVDAFEKKWGVETTPQLFVDGKRIGGTEEISRYLDEARADSAH